MKQEINFIQNPSWRDFCRSCLNFQIKSTLKVLGLLHFLEVYLLSLVAAKSSEDNNDRRNVNNEVLDDEHKQGSTCSLHYHYLNVTYLGNDCHEIDGEFQRNHWFVEGHKVNEV
jgi:hypothetical protein